MERLINFVVLDEGVQIMEMLDGEMEVVYLSFAEVTDLQEAIKKEN